MDGILQKVVSVIIAVVILFILPVYVVYEKKDDIAYALALKITTDFVENVESRGYLSESMYYDFLSRLAVSQNTYDVYIEHVSKKYNPVIYSYTDDHSTIRAKFDYSLYENEYKNGSITVATGANAGVYNNLVLAYDLSEKIYTQDQILSVIDSADKTLYNGIDLVSYKALNRNSLPAISTLYSKKDANSNNIYTMSVGDEFNVIIKNRNTTMASIVYNLITFGAAKQNTTKIYVNYGGIIKAETYRDRIFEDDSANYNPDDKHDDASEVVNSYNRDGLIAFYDGQFNSGSVHSNSAVKWTDLSGNGYDATLANFRNDDESGWIHNGINFSGEEYISLPEINDLEEMTIEVVFRVNDVNDVDHEQVSIVSNMNDGGAALIFNPVNGTAKSSKISYIVADGLDSEAELTPEKEVIQANKTYSVSGTYGHVPVKLLGNSGPVTINFAQLLSINGIVTGKDATNEYVGPATGTTFTIGGSPLAGADSIPEFKGTIYSIRIYNRALSEEEIKENYEIDKKKFDIK